MYTTLIFVFSLFILSSFFFSYVFLIASHFQNLIQRVEQILEMSFIMYPRYELRTAFSITSVLTRYRLVSTRQHYFYGRQERGNSGINSIEWNQTSFTRINLKSLGRNERTQIGKGEEYSETSSVLARENIRLSHRYMSVISRDIRYDNLWGLAQCRTNRNT